MPKTERVGTIKKFRKMAKSSGLQNAPSTTGKPSGGGRGNNPPSTSKSAPSTSKGSSKGGTKK